MDVMDRPLRFGVNMVTPAGGGEWCARCERAEELGFDVINVPDHLGMPAPFPALVAAAAATRRPRLGTFVLNAAFWNPVLLAREIATTAALTEGRLEIGLGTGYVREEHERAGIEFLPPGRRVDRLRRTVEEVTGLLAGEEYRPPLLIGGNGDRVLRLAAEHADIAAFAGVRQQDGVFTLCSPAELDERVAAYHRFAAGRAAPAELNLLLQIVQVTDDRAGAVKELMPYVPQLTEAQVLELPVVAVGTVEEIADQLLGQRERYGFTYFTVLDPAMEAFGPVVAEVRERERRAREGGGR
ncbi:LLM class F420-dependent oxidoreductase [Streptomyces purpureus]|uniref:LLM class F420-dependent oxidoreductase n=2 Tax=Streptomyces purpureus TaxID=1951 RepID=A0A918LRK5_9ACTN|nr:LLM class F420-dependent oxidoreductase [Streptomyces purpureus]